MARENIIERNFRDAMEDCASFTEPQLLDRLNTTIVDVELSDEYSTNEKLKIYSLISSLSNCEARERKRFVKKIAHCLH